MTGRARWKPGRKSTPRSPIHDCGEFVTSRVRSAGFAMSSWQQRTGAQRIIPDHCHTQTVHRVCVAETDMMGIVHHANYVALFERGRLEYLRRRGLPYKEMVGRGLHMPVVELNLLYRKPAHFDDLLRVETRLGALSRVTVRFDYLIERPRSNAQQSAELLAEGHILLACVDAKN